MIPITCCPRCGSHMMRTRHRCELGMVCSVDCLLDDRDLALKRAAARVAAEDWPDWDAWERQAERILRGEFERPWRPHTVFR